jgi:hypothetical protein
LSFSLCLVLGFGFLTGLPLHVAGVIRPAALQRHDVIHHAVAAGWLGVRALELPLGSGRAINTPVAITSAAGAVSGTVTSRVGVATAVPTPTPEGGRTGEGSRVVSSAIGSI